MPMYRGFEYRRTWRYPRGQWGSWEILYYGEPQSECSTRAECIATIDADRRADPKTTTRVRAKHVPKAPRVISDGGRKADGYEHEYNDCAVRAVAHARCISYAAAHADIAQHCKRKDRKGTHGFHTYLWRAPWARHVDPRCIAAKTLDAFALEMNRGHFIFVSSRHAVAVCDGVVLDVWKVSGLLRLEFAFEVIA